MIWQLEALSRDPLLRVPPEQRGRIVENIVHSVMHPYFLRKSPEEQEQFRPKYLEHIRMIEDYCLHEYIEAPEPRLTIELIKGLHRLLYQNVPKATVKVIDGSMGTMIPGEFKAVEVYCGPARHHTTAPGNIAQEMATLLDTLHDSSIPIFHRYLRVMVDMAGPVHPFSDSNGKVALLLGDCFLLKHGLQPPYFARYKWEKEQELYSFMERYQTEPDCDVSLLYPALLQLYADCGIGLGLNCISDRDVANE